MTYTFCRYCAGTGVLLPQIVRDIYPGKPDWWDKPHPCTMCEKERTLVDDLDRRHEIKDRLNEAGIAETDWKIIADYILKFARDSSGRLKDDRGYFGF